MSKQISLTEETANDILNMLETSLDSLQTYSTDVCDLSIKNAADVKKKFIAVHGRKPDDDELESDVNSWKEFRRNYKLAEKICKAFGWQNPFEDFGK